METDFEDQCKEIDDKYSKAKVESIEEVKTLMDAADKCMRSYYIKDFKKRSIVYLNLGI